MNTAFKLKTRNIVRSLIVGTISFVSSNLVMVINDSGGLPTLKQVGISFAIGFLTTVGQLVLEWKKDDVKEAKDVLSEEMPNKEVISFNNTKAVHEEIPG